MAKGKTPTEEWVEGIERDAAWDEMGKKSKQWNEEVEKKGCLGALLSALVLLLNLGGLK
jgi:hypothetical protein